MRHKYRFTEDCQTQVPDPDNPKYTPSLRGHKLAAVPSPDQCFFFRKGSVVEVSFVGSIHYSDDEGDWELPLEILDDNGFKLPWDTLEQMES